MLTRADVERITENVLRELRVEVHTDNFTAPNSRVVTLKYRDEIISTDYFDIADRPEYDG